MVRSLLRALVLALALAAGSASASNVYVVCSAALGQCVVTPSADCYTVAGLFANWLQAITQNYVFRGNACAQDASGLLTGFSLDEYKTTGTYVGSPSSGALTISTFSGVEPPAGAVDGSGLPIDPVAVTAVFAAMFIGVLGLYFFSWGVRQILNAVKK